MYKTYVLKSVKDGRRYIGYTENVIGRLDVHNNGFNPSTNRRRPFKLVCFKEFNTKIEALKYEKYLKKLKGGKQLDIEIDKMSKNAVVAQLVPRKCGAW